MFAYKTTIGPAPLYLNLLVQTYVPSRSLRKWTTPCGAIPKRVPNHSHGPFPGLCPAGGWPSDLNSNSWVFSHFQKTSKRHIFFSSTWPTNTNTYLFYLKKKNPSYMYCARLTETVMALVYCCSLNGLIASIVLLICTSLWIKASAKWLI